MILYNVTVNVESKIADEWISWMKNEHIPEVMQTGYFEEFRFFKLLTETGNPNPSYAIQYFADSLATLNQYIKEKAPDLQQKHLEKYGENCLAFRTVLEEV